MYLTTVGHPKSIQPAKIPIETSSIIQEPTSTMASNDLPILQRYENLIISPANIWTTPNTIDIANIVTTSLVGTKSPGIGKISPKYEP